MLRTMLAVVAGLAISVGLDTGPSGTGSSATGDVGQVQLALGNRNAHCKPGCGPHMECVCSPRGCFPGVCCWCAPK